MARLNITAVKNALRMRSMRLVRSPNYTLNGAYWLIDQTGKFVASTNTITWHRPTTEDVVKWILETSWTYEWLR